MSAIVADTHALVWYLTEPQKLTQKALTAIDKTIEEGNPVMIPSICLVELYYLVEKGKLPNELFERVLKIVHQPQSMLKIIPLELAIVETMPQIPRELVPEMPDRLIATTAKHLGLPLVTCDSAIHKTDLEIIW